MLFETVYKGELEIVAIFDGMGGCDDGEIDSLVSAKEMQGLHKRLLENKIYTEENHTVAWEKYDYACLARKRQNR